MEFITGQKLSEYLKKEKDPEKRKALAKRVGSIALDQLFFKKVFHADPHPGNIFLIGDVVCFLDFGIVKHITESQKKSIQKMVFGIFSNNYEMLTESVIEMTDAPIELFEELERDVEYLLETYSQAAVGEINISEFTNDIIGIVNKRNLIIPSSYTQMVKTLSIIEGIALELYPDFSLIEIIKPFFEENKSASYDSFKKSSIEFGTSYLDIATIFPKKFKNITKKIENNDIHIKISITNMFELKTVINKASNSFVFGVITGSIVVGSSIVLNSKIPPLVNGVSVLGLLGYGFAGIMGFAYMISVFFELIKANKQNKY